MTGRATVLGTLQLKGRQLHLDVNSVRRPERATAMLGDALGPLVGPPLTRITLSNRRSWTTPT